MQVTASAESTGASGENQHPDRQVVANPIEHGHQVIAQRSIVGIAFQGSAEPDPANPICDIKTQSFHVSNPFKRV
jgi:hypothetical protein